MEKEGYKQVWIPEALYKELQARSEDQKKHPRAAQKPIGGGGCTLVIQQTGGGMTFSCSGGCGIIDRFLGRSCTKQHSNTDDGGVQVFCTCTGGWFDRIFR